MPALPGWSIRDTYAHLAGVCADALDGNLEGVATPPWTAAQLAARVDRTFDELTAEWLERGPQFDDALGVITGRGAVMASVDVWSHEQDIRGALGQRGERDDDRVRFLVERGMEAFAGRFGEAGVTLTIVLDGDRRVVGPGDPSATWTTDGYELMRTLTGRRTSGMTADEAAALYRLMTWLSPSFPVGAFSYSSGIEWAVEAGDITDAASLRGWLAAMLTEGAGFCDAVFLAQVHRAASARDDAGLREIAELAAAFVPSRERQLETTTQGRAFIDIARSAWACEGLDNMVAACGGAIVYPIAVGLVSAAHAIPVAPAMHAFLHALVSNWISAGARLVPLGQTDSQRILASLEVDVVSTAKRALELSLDDLGGATFRADLASLRHETQYTRLFRS